MFEVPNLDDFSHDPEDQLEASRVLRILASYCEHKAASIASRRAGMIDLALAHERGNEARFNSLPQWAKW